MIFILTSLIKKVRLGLSIRNTAADTIKGYEYEKDKYVDRRRTGED